MEEEKGVSGSRKEEEVKVTGASKEEEVNLTSPNKDLKEGKRWSFLVTSIALLTLV